MSDLVEEVADSHSHLGFASFNADNCGGSVASLGNVTQESVQEPVTTFDHCDHKLFCMAAKHKRSNDSWDEWCGQNRFADSRGDIKGCDKQRCHKWCKNVLSVHQCSRTKCVIQGVKNVTDQDDKTALDALKRLESKWDSCDQSPANFVLCSHSIGAVPKKLTRGKN